MSFRYERAHELIEQAAGKGRLAHAYLLMGPPGSGKERLASHIIALSNPGARPPNELDGWESGTTTIISPESKSRKITVEAIRAVEHTLQLAAPAGVTKFAVIQDADRMTAEASNAFLKTLEEPPAASRLLLLTARPEMLLETILSRCIRIPLAGKEVSDDPGARMDEFLGKLAELGEKSGLGRALGLAADFSELLKAEKEAIEKANKEAEKAEGERYKKTTDAESYLKEREKYWEAITASEYVDRRSRLLEYLIIWFGDALRHKHGVAHRDLPGYAAATAALADRNSVEALTDRYGAVETLRDQLVGTNVNESLALDVAFMKAFG